MLDRHRVTGSSVGRCAKAMRQVGGSRREHWPGRHQAGQVRRSFPKPREVLLHRACLCTAEGQDPGRDLRPRVTAAHRFSRRERTRHLAKGEVARRLHRPRHRAPEAGEQRRAVGPSPAQNLEVRKGKDTGGPEQGKQVRVRAPAALPQGRHPTILESTVWPSSERLGLEPTKLGHLEA